jgi:hypothetical protein
MVEGKGLVEDNRTIAVTAATAGNTPKTTKFLPNR